MTTDLFAIQQKSNMQFLDAHDAAGAFQWLHDQHKIIIHSVGYLNVLLEFQ